MKRSQQRPRRSLKEEAKSVLDTMTDSTRLSLDSVDDQIDSYIIKFEKEAADAAQSEEEMIFEALRTKSMLRFLLEQDDVSDLSDPAADPTAEEPPPDDESPTGSEEPKATVKPAPLVKTQLDIDAFTKKVARLVMMSDRLLDVKSVILNRSLMFLQKNYTDEHVARMKEILETQFDFNMGDEEFFTPPDAEGSEGKPTGAGLGTGGGGGET
jgi:hypothetical protein